MRLFLGIDGGGTHTRAFLADEEGRILARSEAGQSNPGHASDAELREQFSSLFRGLFNDDGRRPEACVSAFGGIAGVTCESTASRVRAALRECGIAHAPIGIDHDIRIALAGGLGGRPGIALIVGTGSSCYGRDAEGRTCQTGGWGSLVADEGSGYYFGREAIVAAVRIADGRLPESPMRDAVFAWLGIGDVSEILKRLYEDGLSRTDTAAFAPTVLELAEQGDPAAVDILDRGAEELARMVAANHRRLPTSERPEVAVTGGLGTAPTLYRKKLEAAIGRQLPEARIAELFMDPTAGAVMLAMEQAGVAVTPALLRNLRSVS